MGREDNVLIVDDRMVEYYVFWFRWLFSIYNREGAIFLSEFCLQIGARLYSSKCKFQLKILR